MANDEPVATPPEGDGVRDLGWVAFAVMGTTIASCEAVGVGAGIFVDHQWGTAPVGILVGIVLGSVIAVVSVITQVRRYL